MSRPTYEILYRRAGVEETWQGRPGRLWTEIPHSPAEVALAVQWILDRCQAESVTIRKVEAEGMPKGIPPLSSPTSEET